MHRSLLYIFASIFLCATALVRCADSAAPSGTPPSTSLAEPGFSTAILPIGKNPGSIGTADFNRDDRAGHFEPLKGSPFPTGKSPSRIAIGDLNGDSINDIAVTNYNDGTITPTEFASGILIKMGKMISRSPIRMTAL